MTSNARLWLAIIVVAVLVRLATLGAYPLADTTEARYAEIARLMVASGDWITPQIEPGIAFWAKPPLLFWLTAGSFTLLGLTEFAARLPALLLLLGCLGLVIAWGWSEQKPIIGLAAAAILITTALGFISAGAVMTDPALALCTTLSMVGFWRAIHAQQRAWGYIFFLGLALGLLAKGPIAWVLILLPVALWVLWQQRWQHCYQRLPWLEGIALITLLAAPWYLIAEIKTPGFWHYFFIGEHWLRFLDSGWQGDLYGSAHAQPRGTIWLFALVAALPWSIFGLLRLFSYAKHKAFINKSIDISSQQGYLLLWAFTPVVFFSFAGNILMTYVLPSLPALALLLAGPLSTQTTKHRHWGWLLPGIFVILGPSLLFERVAAKSQRDLIDDMHAISTVGHLIYLYKRPLSASFYSSGAAGLAASPTDAVDLLAQAGKQFFAIPSDALAKLPAALRAKLQVVATYSQYSLLAEQQSLSQVRR